MKLNSKISQFLSSIYSNKKKLIFIIILIIGISLRFYQLEKSIWLQSGYDESRDMLVAKHILENKEWVNRGPLAAGGLNWLKNSPVYFYFASVIWFLSGNPVAFMYLWTTLMTITIWLSYLIGKKANGEKLGFILAGLSAVDTQMVFRSRELLQPNLLLIFSLLFTISIVHLIFEKKHKLRNLNIAILSLLLPLHFHYGILIALPIGALWLAYFWFELIANSSSIKDYIKKLIIPIFIGLSFLIFWVFLTYNHKPFDQVNFFVFNFSQKETFTNEITFIDVYKQILNMGWHHYARVALLTLLIGVVIALVNKFKSQHKINLKFRKILQNKQTKFVLFIFSMTLSLFLTLFYHHYLAETYLLFIYPFIIILVGLLLNFIISQSKITGIITIGIIFFLSLILNKKIYFDQLPLTSFHAQQKQIAQDIFEHYSKIQKNLEIDDFGDSNDKPKLLITWYTTNSDMPFDGWGTSGTWYYLEEKFNMPLVVNINYSLNHTPIQKFPKILYMVCDYRTKTELIKTECWERFTRTYPMAKVEPEKLSETQDLSLWVGLVDNNYEKSIWNQVHHDMLD